MSASQLLVGYASATLTVPDPVHLLGQFHMRLNTGVQDDVAAQVMFLGNDADSVIFVSIDTEEIQPYLVTEVQRKVHLRNARIPVESLLLHATHPHGAPSYLRDDHPGLAEAAQFPHPGYVIPSGDSYRAEMTDRLAEAILRAWDNRAPGAMAYGYGYATAGHCRRVCYYREQSGRTGIARNGTCVMYGSTDTAEFSHFENGGGDAMMQVLYTFDRHRTLTGAVICLPCPFQLDESDERTTASFAHEIRETIRSIHPELPVLLLSGAGGDVSPRMLYAKQAEDRRFRLKYAGETAKSSEYFRRRDIAERVGAAFEEILSWASRELDSFPKIRHLREIVPLPARQVSLSEYEYVKTVRAEWERAGEWSADDGSREEVLRHNSTRQSVLNLADEVLRRYERPVVAWDVEVHAIRLGDFACVTVPLELYQDYHYQVQARSPMTQTMVVQMVNDSLGYLSTTRADAGGGYSAGYLNKVSPEGGRILVDRLLALLLRTKADE